MTKIKTTGAKSRTIRSTTKRSDTVRPSLVARALGAKPVKRKASTYADRTDRELVTDMLKALTARRQHLPLDSEKMEAYYLELQEQEIATCRILAVYDAAVRLVEAEFATGKNELVDAVRASDRRDHLTGPGPRYQMLSIPGKRNDGADTWWSVFDVYARVSVPNAMLSGEEGRVKMVEMAKQMNAK